MAGMLYSYQHSMVGKMTVFLLTRSPVDNNRNASLKPVEFSASPYLTRRQAAAYLNVSEKWLAQSGRAIGPRFHKFGSQCRYLRDDVINWARQQRATQ